MLCWNNFIVMSPVKLKRHSREIQSGGYTTKSQTFLVSCVFCRIYCVAGLIQRHPNKCFVRITCWLNRSMLQHNIHRGVQRNTLLSLYNGTQATRQPAANEATVRSQNTVEIPPVEINNKFTLNDVSLIFSYI